MSPMIDFTSMGERREFQHSIIFIWYTIMDYMSDSMADRRSSVSSCFWLAFSKFVYTRCTTSWIDPS